MFGFGPMSEFYNENFEKKYNPVKPFSQSEFSVHNDDELEDIDAGRDYYRQPCPKCGASLKIRDDAAKVRCSNCGVKFHIT